MELQHLSVILDLNCSCYYFTATEVVDLPLQPKLSYQPVYELYKSRAILVEPPKLRMGKGKLQVFGVDFTETAVVLVRHLMLHLLICNAISH